MSDNKFFEASDGWLFAVLLLNGGKRIKLKNILIIGDTINHAIFTLKEINEGLSRLVSQGFIEFDGQNATLTNKAKQLIKDNKKPFEKSIEMQLRYSKIFSEMPLTKDIVCTDYFSQEEYTTSLNEI